MTFNFQYFFTSGVGNYPFAFLRGFYLLASQSSPLLKGY